MLNRVGGPGHIYGVQGMATSYDEKLGSFRVEAVYSILGICRLSMERESEK